MKKGFKEMSLRSIIMILCSSFVSLVIVTSATFYITGISHINNLVKQNAANLTIQAAENMDRRFRKVKDSFFSSIMESYYFLKMGQNIMENRQPISAKHYAELARKIQDYVNQNRQDVSVVILMLSNNSIVLTASSEEKFYRCYQPEYDAFYRKFTGRTMNWIYSDDAAGFIGNSKEIPHLGMIQMLGSKDSEIHGFLYIGMSNKGIARELSSYHITNSNSLALMKENTFFLAGDSSADAVDIDLKKNYIVSERLKEVPLDIVAIIPKNELFIDRNNFQMLVFGESVISVLFCFLLFMIITKVLSAPVEELVRQLDAVENLTQLATARAVGGRDFRKITEAINHLYQRIQILIMSLKEENQYRKDAELKILYAQINPHFLYNTLDSIGQLCEMGESESACQMVYELADFYRIGVSKGADFITLEEEIRHVTAYLSILQTRFEDFHFQIEVPEELAGTYVPKIILQPLAENAVYHGIHSGNGDGNIRITGKREGEDLFLEISDNGNGIEEELLEKIRRSLQLDELKAEQDAKIYGLKNVQQRIVLQYGAQYGISIFSMLEQGTRVLIKLPYLTQI
jgi:two-component system sensor histidine kinase YesM